MDTFNRITKLQMIIPTEHIPTMLDQLVQEFPLKEQYHEILDWRKAIEALIWLLGKLDWNAIALPDGRVKIVQYTGDVLDLELNPVLKNAIGIVSPGCFIEGYSEENRQWQLRYHLSRTTIIHGTVAFPRDPTWENLARTLTIIRDAYPLDQQQLTLFIHRPLDWTEGHILVLEHADGIRALLQYHLHQQIEQTAIVTRIATHPLGRTHGYPQALVKALQQRYRRILIEHPSSNYKREWKKLGFLEINKEEKTKFGCSTDTFSWTKEAVQDEDHLQKEHSEGAFQANRKGVTEDD